MSRAHASRFAMRDRGLRRVRVVTVWSAIGSAGVAIAAAVALVPSTASAGSAAGHAGTKATPTGGPTDSGVPDRTARHSSAPAGTRSPHPRHTTSTPRLEPPTTPPATSDGGQQHATSGGS